MASLESQLAAQGAATWNPHREPSHDKFVKGVLLTRGVFDGDFGQSPIHTIDRGDPSPDAKPPGRFVRFICFGAVAGGEDEEKNPQEGEAIAWLYTGTGTVREGANAGKEYAVFRLFVERDGNKPTSDIPEPPPEVAGEPSAGDEQDEIPFFWDEAPGYLASKVRWQR